MVHEHRLACFSRDGVMLVFAVTFGLGFGVFGILFLILGLGLEGVLMKG